MGNGLHEGMTPHRLVGIVFLWRVEKIFVAGFLEQIKTIFFDGEILDITLAPCARYFFEFHQTKYLTMEITRAQKQN